MTDETLFHETEQNAAALELDAESFCKICLEVKSEEAALISPCRCAGTMRYVHEECLKAWLLARQSEINDSACEVCKYVYNMQINIKQKCEFKKRAKFTAFRVVQYVFIGGMIVGLSISTSILLIALHNADGEKNDGVVIGLFVTFFMLLLMLVTLISCLTSDFKCVHLFKDWRILGIKPDRARKLNRVHAYENQDELSESSQRFHEQILVIPEVIQVRGRTTDVPLTGPSMRRLRTTSPSMQVYVIPLG